MTFASGPAGNAAVDLKTALDEAQRAGDRPGHDWLQDLAFDYLSEKLARLSRKALEAHLGTLRVWREDGAHAVFKTVGEPAVAFVALESDTGVQIMALGFCYRCLGTEEDWWQNVIRPRLRHYL